MRPDTSNYIKDLFLGETYFGELDEYNQAHGRGIKIWNDGTIQIGYFEDGYYSTGHYIHILSDGEFEVGEYYVEDRVRRRRCTWYKTNGTEEKYDY